MDKYRTGLLLIRAWIEKGSSKPLRAHIRTTTDVSKGFEMKPTVANDVPATTKVVEKWLEDVVEDQELNAEAAGPRK